MNISGFEFLLFFLPAFVIVYNITTQEYKKAVLLAASLIFYGMGQGLYTLLLLGSCIVNYLLLKLPEKHRKKIYVIVLNAGLLLLCKYTPIFPAIPLGISFYTFRAMGVFFDTQGGGAPMPDKFMDYAAYICCFPLVSMGPVTSYKNTDMTLRHRHFSPSGTEEGLMLVCAGLAAKVLLADRIGILYTDVRTIGMMSVSPALAWMAALSYSFQLYFDFAGYSLMAKGLMKIIGTDIPNNFNLPYTATSVTDFWRRWHISLGTWFKEYVYIPLGGNKKGNKRTILNLLAVWVLTSVWHGPGINFIFWGAFVFAHILLEKQLKEIIQIKSPVIKHIYMALFIPISWALFSVSDIPELGRYLLKLVFGPFGAAFAAAPQVPLTAALKDAFGSMLPGGLVPCADAYAYLQQYGVLFVICMIFSLKYPGLLYEKYRHKPVTALLMVAVALMCFYRISLSAGNAFLYFDF